MGLFDPGGINKSNRQYIQDLQAKRASGDLGLSDAQKDAMIARGQEQIGAATQAALSQMPPSGVDAGSQQRAFQGAMGAMDQSLAQQKMGADLASEQQAANQAAELAAQEQGLFQRRKDKRDYFTKTVPQGVASAAQAAGGIAALA